MKKLLTILFILSCFFGAAQVYTPQTAAGYQYKRIKIDSTFHIPTFCGTPNLRSVLSIKQGALAFDSCGHKLYFYDPKTLAWDTIRAGSGSGQIIIGGTNLNTDSIPEGSFNLYFTTDRVRSSLYADAPIYYDPVLGRIYADTSTPITGLATKADLAHIDTAVIDVTGSQSLDTSIITITKNGGATNKIKFLPVAETDPTVSSYIKTITSSFFAHGETAYSWGNHALAGYLTSFTESDPVWTAASGNYRTLTQNNLLYAAISHTHPASDIISGVFPIVRGGLGLSTIGTVGQSIRVASGGIALEYYTPSDVDTSFLRRDINLNTANILLRLKYSDTASMLLNYWNAINTNTANILLKLNISDTANIRFRPVAGSNITLSGTYPNITIAAIAGAVMDTMPLHNGIVANTTAINLRVKYSDTAAMLSPYLKSITAGATYQPIGSYQAAGNFFTRSGDSTSYTWYPNQTVATSAPVNGIKEFDSSGRLHVRTSLNKTYSLSTSLIPTNGSVIDTFPNESGTFLMRQDTSTFSSVYQNGLKVNISDTGTMLSPYLRAVLAASTYATIANLNLKINIADTGAMLLPYLTTILAGATYQPLGSYATTSGLALKVNIADTGAMLSPYLRKIDSTIAARITANTTNIATNTANIATNTSNIALKADKSTTLTINGVAYDLSANRSWSITAGVWGAITGTLSAQTDLQAALDAKAGITVKQTHTSGPTVTVSNATTWLIVNPASLLAVLTITMPATPTDAQKVEISFGGTVTSGAVVTALTISPNSGQAILQSSTPSIVEAGETISYRYNSTNLKWYRL